MASGWERWLGTGPSIPNCYRITQLQMQVAMLAHIQLLTTQFGERAFFWRSVGCSPAVAYTLASAVAVVHIVIVKFVVHHSPKAIYFHRTIFQLQYFRCSTVRSLCECEWSFIHCKITWLHLCTSTHTHTQTHMCIISIVSEVFQQTHKLLLKLHRFNENASQLSIFLSSVRACERRSYKW